MEVIPYISDNAADYLNSIIMVPNKSLKINDFYKITGITDKFFIAQRMKCITTQCNANTYEAKISDEFEDEPCKKIKKTSINRKYPIIITRIVRYEY